MDWNWAYMAGVAALNNLVLWVWKPWSQSYANEKAKNFARKEDLDKILAEVRAVTAATEVIKSDINGGLWERQMRWNEKRDTYARLIEKALEMQSVLTEIEAHNRSEPDPDRLTARGSEARWRLFKLNREFQALGMMAFIFANDACVAALRDHGLRVRPEIDFDSETYIRSEMDSLDEIVGRLVLAAKEDLGSSREL